MRPLAVCIEQGLGRSLPAESHQSLMADLRARLGMRTMEGEEKSMEREESSAGVKLSSLQAWMLIRSKLSPVGMMMGSAIG